MRHISTGIFAFLLALLLSACATKRYGRMQPLTEAEQQAYDCEDINLEIAKIEGFRLQIAGGAKINFASVAGFLGDYGIGNAMEKNAAEKSATERMVELQALSAEKGCSSPPPVEVDPS